jgi:hypothetical protein
MLLLKITQTFFVYLQRNPIVRSERETEKKTINNRISTNFMNGRLMECCDRPQMRCKKD